MAIPGWYFEPYPDTGGANAGAYRNTLAGAGLNIEDLIARETVQNSVDARQVSADKSVRVRFSSIEFDGQELDRLRELLLLTGSSEGPLQRPGILSTDEEAVSVEERLRSPFRAVLLEDFNTLGLGGIDRANAPSTKEDRYVRFALNLGDTQEETGRGGTFGYGKSAYWAGSSIWTILIYSRFEETHRTHGANSRLVGVSWFRDHVHEELRHTGRAWFCDRAAGPDEAHVKPFTNKDAHNIAQQLGFKARGPKDLGTSMMILGADVDFDKLNQSVEYWWWPRLLRDELEVEFGDATIEPRPRDRQDLCRFIRAWELATDQAKASDDDFARDVSFNRKYLGEFAVTSKVSDEVTHVEKKERVQIALMRDPGMVVEYCDGPFIRTGHPVADAVFVAAPEINSMLSKSEPPGHERWDYKSTRRDRPLEKPERKRVRKIYEKVKGYSSQFLREKREEPPEPPDRCTELEKMLGRFLAVDKSKPNPPPPEKKLFSVEFETPPHRTSTNEGVVIDAKLSISLSSDSDGEERLVQVLAWIETVADRTSVGEREPVRHLTAADESGVLEYGTIDGETSAVVYEVKEDSVVIVDIRSAPLPNEEYCARLAVSVEAVA